MPPGYRRSAPPRRPKLGPFTGIIDRILEDDRTSHRKQRHTAKRIFDRLRDEYGFTGGYTIVKDYVREQGLRSREVFVPLSHSPGHAQADFGEAMAVIGGALRKIHFLAFDLPHSDGCFVAAYPAETTEAFCDGHNAAFAFFGGVPRSILYDNTKLAVARILGDGKRQRTRVFTELQSHYLFEDRFGRPGKGKVEGKVEGLVGFIRRNFLVPVPRAESFAALNDALAEQCRRRQAARLRGHKETIGERLERDRQVLLPLPPAPYDACDKRPGRASSLSLVRYRSNDYSVPVAYGHREVLIRGYVDEVVISCGAEVIARHRRSYDSEDLIFDPLHYLPLIEQKIGALDQAAPLAGWDLPEAFITLRRLLEARMGKAGKREYVQVLRLLETFRLEYDKIARQCASEGVDHVRYLLRLAELELIDRERRMVERRIKAARFPVVKSLDSFDFKVIPSLNKALVLELARCEYIERRENLIALGNSGTGKTHIALGLGLAACQKGLSVGFITAAALVHELIEARDDKQLLRFQKKLATYKLLIVDELGFVPLSKTGAELLFEVFSQRYERGSTLVTTNLPFDEWTEVFGSERLTGALLDRLTHHVNILEMNGDSYRLNQSRRRQTPTAN